MICTPIVEMLTIAPERRARIPGSTALIIATAPKKLSVEQFADVGVIAFLDGCAVTVAGVVDQHVDAAELLLRPIGRVSDLRGVGDVEG